MASRAGIFYLSCFVGVIVSRKKRKTKARQPAPKSVRPGKVRKALSVALPVLTVAALGIVAYLVFFSDTKSTTKPTTTPTVASKTLTAT